MYGLNEKWFVFYWRADKDDVWQVSQPVTMGDLIEGEVELYFPDGESLPMSNINWGSDEVKYAEIVNREDTKLTP